MSATAFRKVTQISESHCGPAVIEMLFDVVGVQFSQSQVAHAAGINHTIQKHGARVDQLALAVSRLAPHLSFWYKYHAELRDLQYVIHRGYPVAVEWQGIFYGSLEEQQRHDDGDSGHYSVVSHIDFEKNELIIVDPYKDFVHQDRILAIPTFLERWWDTNDVEDEDTGKMITVRDDHLLFFVTPEFEQFSIDDGFKQYISLD